MSTQQTWRACDMSDEFVMSHEHAIKLAVEQEIILYLYLFFIEKWLTILKIYLIEYLDNDFIKLFVFSISIAEIKRYIVQASKTILLNFSILSFHTKTSIYHLIKNRSTTTLYQRLIARRRRHIYTNHRNATYSKLHVEQMTSMNDVENKIYRSTKTSIISFNCSTKTRRLYRFHSYEWFDHCRSTKIRNRNCTDHMMTRTTNFVTTSFYMIATCNRLRLRQSFRRNVSIYTL